MTLAPTPGQTVGPFFGYALPYDGDSELVPAGTTRTRSACTARCYDGAGDPVPDALLEIWQADPTAGSSQAEGSLRRDGYTFTGCGRAATDDDRPLLLHHRAPGPDRGRAQRRSSR